MRRSSDLTPADACAPFGFAVGESPLRSVASAAHLSSMPSCMEMRKRPNVVAFAFKKDNVAKLDGVKPGMRVKVGFAVDGREWTDPKTGKVRYFSDLTALRLGRLDGAEGVPEPAEPNNLPPDPDDEIEMPF